MNIILCHLLKIKLKNITIYSGFLIFKLYNTTRENKRK